MNLYAVLGLPQDADPDRIRSAFRTLVKRYHPDAGDGSSVEKFRQLLIAYETLHDPIRRADYDRTLGRERGHAAAPVHVEPLMPQPTAESLFSRRRVPIPDDAFRRYPPVHVDDLIEEFLQIWQEAICGEVSPHRL
jgi:curved DNA-binding protein CbpA